MVGGRAKADYNTILVFDKIRTAESGAITISEGGVIVGDRPLSAGLIDQIIVDSPLYGSQKGKSYRWCLFHRKPVDSTIYGYVHPGQGGVNLREGLAWQGHESGPGLHGA